MGESEEFNPLSFEKKLAQLKDTQDCIQAMSAWCLKHRDHHKKIVSSWLNVLKRAKVEQRLVLFYLANDVIQYSKRKNYEFVESWGLNLQKATPLVRDERVRHKILRIFKIWEQRSVYDEEFLSDLTGLLSAGAVKKAADDDASDFQPQLLVNKIKQCSDLEADTDLRLKNIHESHLELSDSDALCATLKERRNTDDMEKELGEGIACVERYTAALQREIVAREALLVLLSSAHHYYATQRGEVKVVAYAYKNFGARVRNLKRKLDELVVELPCRAPSPPQRDEDVPSPGPDEDLDLPMTDGIQEEESYNIDKTFNTSVAVGQFASFLGTDNPFSLFHENTHNSNDITAEAVAGNKIEVINSRPNVDKQEFNINEFLKTLLPAGEANPLEKTPVATGLLTRKNQEVETLPGLDLLTPESTGNPPRASFYGSIENSLQEEPEPYNPEPINRWDANTSWSVNSSLPPTMVPPVAASMPPLLTPPPVPMLTPPVPPPISLITPPRALPVALLMPMTPPGPPPPLYTETPESPPAPLVPESRLYTQVPRPRSPPAALLMPMTPPGPPPALYTETPESPPPPLVPPVAPLLMPEMRLYVKDLPRMDVDHRGLLPPPPPPPILPPMSQLGDVDHRLLPSLMNPVTTAASTRHVSSHKDVDHRNLISLTSHPPSEQQEMVGGMDQDYRVPMTVGRSDIVESVDMDLSDDEDQHSMQEMHYSKQQVQRGSLNQQNFGHSTPNYKQDDTARQRTFSQNNKVLIGGDNGKINNRQSETERHSNLIRINSIQSDMSYEEDGIYDNIEKPQMVSTPVNQPMINPFDNMPNNLKRSVSQANTNNAISTISSNYDTKFSDIEEAIKTMDSDNRSDDSAYDEDIRTRFIEPIAGVRELVRNPSPPVTDIAEDEWIRKESEWSNPPPNHNRFYVPPNAGDQMNPQFQRPWAPNNVRPQQNFRPTSYNVPQQFWPRNVPRPPINRLPWMGMGQRPQRGGFW